MNQPIATHKHFRTSLLFVFTGAVLFNAVFWHEKLALNMAIFSVFSIIAITLLYKDALKSNHAKWLLVAVVCSLAMVLIYNSAISGIACLTSVILFTAYSKYKHRSLVYAIASAMQSLLHAMPQLFFNVKHCASPFKKEKNTFNRLRIAIIPVLLMLIFFFVYVQSSKVFSDILLKLSNQIADWIYPVLNWAKPERFLFLLLGLLIISGLLYRSFKAPFQDAEAGMDNDLQRKKNLSLNQKKSMWQNLMQLFIGHKADSLLALKYEYKAGVLSLITLNVLLVFVNATDVLYLWIGRQYEPGFAWADYVHEGAEMLIVSILMAMLVVLFFFRGNLNFFKEKKRLQTVAYIWLLQNAFLTASVCLRNYYYITHMALTYKRIGLFVFTILVFVGLISVYIKIRFVKSNYYLIKFNAGVGFATLVLATFLQWDVMIAKYNLQQRDRIPLDTSFLLTLSDHALPVLQQHKDLFTKQQMVSRQVYSMEDGNSMPVTILDYRIAHFLEEQEKYTWLSWNLADVKTRQALLSEGSLQAAK